MHRARLLLSEPGSTDRKALWPGQVAKEASLGRRLILKSRSRPALRRGCRGVGCQWVCVFVAPCPARHGQGDGVALER